MGRACSSPTPSSAHCKAPLCSDCLRLQVFHHHDLLDDGRGDRGDDGNDQNAQLVHQEAHVSLDCFRFRWFASIVVMLMMPCFNCHDGFDFQVFHIRISPFDHLLTGTSSKTEAGPTMANTSTPPTQGRSAHGETICLK